MRDQDLVMIEEGNSIIVGKKVDYKMKYLSLSKFISENFKSSYFVFKENGLLEIAKMMFPREFSEEEVEAGLKMLETSIPSRIYSAIEHIKELDIDRAFRFSKSPEKEEYWYDVHEKIINSIELSQDEKEKINYYQNLFEFIYAVKCDKSDPRTKREKSKVKK